MYFDLLNPNTMFIFIGTSGLARMQYRTWHKFPNPGGAISTKKCPISNPEGTILQKKSPIYNPRCKILIKYVLLTTQGAQL